jgi:hypothetical protein
MPYARRNWTAAEVERALANPRSSSSGPAAHSHIHGVAGELANHPLFQRARVTAEIYQSNHQGNLVHGPDARKHSTLPAPLMAAGVALAFCTDRLQPYLARLDAGSDMKVKVNFLRPLGTGQFHQTGHGSRIAEMKALFIYCKPNPGNRDIPIFQTVIPMENHYNVGQGNDPLIVV